MSKDQISLCALTFNSHIIRYIYEIQFESITFMKLVLF